MLQLTTFISNHFAISNYRVLKAKYYNVWVKKVTVLLRSLELISSSDKSQEECHRTPAKTNPKHWIICSFERFIRNR